MSMAPYYGKIIISLVVTPGKLQKNNFKVSVRFYR